MRMFVVFNCGGGALKGTRRTARFSSSPSVPDKLKNCIEVRGESEDKAKGSRNLSHTVRQSPTYLVSSVDCLLRSPDGLI